ncbi:MAG: hypothetical protein IKV54_01990 [Clostridia bacterium]|nr:hypothetical protein [Clostridia bacterium]
MKKNKAAPPAADKSKKLRKALSRLGLLLLVFALFVTIYEMSLLYRFYEPVILVYYILAGVGIVAVFILNRGLNSRPTEREMLSDDLTEEEKDAYLEEEKKRMRISRVLMYFILPLIVVIFIDLIDLYFGGIYKSLLASLGGKRS